MDCTDPKMATKGEELGHESLSHEVFGRTTYDEWCFIWAGEP
jgi:hypothetical protein